MINIESKLLQNEKWYNYKKFIDTRKNWDRNNISIALADISPSEYKPFNFGINIIDKIVNNSEYNCGRAIWETGKESMEWFTKKEINKFDVIGINCYMYYQLFGIPAFLFDNKINPISKYRKNEDPIILLGGQSYYFTNGYDKFIDIACIGEGEEFIIEILNIIKKYKSNREKILIEASKIKGAYVPIIHKDNIITKRIIEKENLHKSLLDKNCIESKTTRKVIEIARGCKYNCGFCSLSKRMYPFRENKYDNIRDVIDTFKDGEHIYPFAPDESSFSKHEELEDYCNFKNFKYFRYNFRLNTITKNDILKRNVSNQIVLGIDGISQRIIDITDKSIKLNKLTEEIAPLIFKQNYALLKLNYVFNYSFETDEDYKELEVFWRKLIDLRIEAKAKTMIQIAPTPFVPEYYVPLQFLSINREINPKLEQIYNSIKKDYFDNKKIIPLFKMEGLQGYKNYLCSVLLHRLDNLSEFIYFCFKNNYRTSKYNEKLYTLFIKYLNLKKIKISDLLAELDIEKNYWFDRVDWSAGILDYKNINRNRYKKLIEKIS